MFDVVIIGAGLSGLAAGIRLAHFGQKVCILERHTVWGGLNSFYKKDGHHFDSGLHAVTNYAAPGSKRGPLGTLCRQLRIKLEDFGLEPQTFSRITVNGASIDFSNGLDLVTAEVARAFPSEVDGFARLCAASLEYPIATIDRPFASSRARIREFLSDPLLIEMILVPLFFYGAATEDDLDWDLFVVLFNSVFREGFGRPRRGIKQILDLLVSRFEESGGEMRRRAGVARLVVDEGRVTSVVLDDGSVVSGRTVLSSAGLVETARLRSDRPADDLAESIGPVAFMESQHILASPSTFTPCVTFYCNGPSLRWRSPVEPVDLTSGVICAPHNYQHSTAPERQTIRITHLANDAYWTGLGASDEAQYAASKADWVARSRVSVEPYTGKLDVKYTESFTPRTVRYYTGHLGGAIYGSPHKVKSGKTDLSNLFLCGTDQGLLGIVGAMLSGVAIANANILGGAR